MKKLKIICEILISYIAGIGSAIGVYFTTETNLDWRTYLETVLMPNIVAAVAAIVSLYIAALPVLNLIKKAAQKFTSATEGIINTQNADKQNLKLLQMYEKRINSFEEKMSEIDNTVAEGIKGIDSKIEEISCDAKKIERMSMIGFGNMSELVRGGYASKIGKVYSSNEEDEI